MRPNKNSLREAASERLTNDELPIIRKMQPSDYAFLAAISALNLSFDDLPDHALVILRFHDPLHLQEGKESLRACSQYLGKLSRLGVMNAGRGIDENTLPNFFSTAAAKSGVLICALETAQLGLLERRADLDISLKPLSWQSCCRVAEKLAGEDKGSHGIPLPWITLANPLIWNLAYRPGMSSDEILEMVMRLAAPFEGSVLATQQVTKGLTLEDCPGMGAAQDWAEQLVEDLADYKDGKLKWDDIDRGILLCGPPGCGKTRFAQALAGSAGVNFVATSSAAWMSSRDGNMGTYIQAMKADFKKAKTEKPSILFIDEIDAVGNRDVSNQHSSWHTGTVTALLEQLDGVSGREDVVVVAATNNRNSVDPALLRSGRLDRVVKISLPDDAAREAIFRVHLKDNLLDADLAAAVHQSEGGSGADIERWCREARRIARKAKRSMELDDLLDVVRIEGQDHKISLGFCR